MLFRKEILTNGEVSTLGRMVKISPDRVSKLVSTFNALTSKGYKVPVVLGHPQEFSDPAGWPYKPVSAEEPLLRSSAGFVTGLTVDGDKVYADMDIRDEQVGKKLTDKTIACCSPMIVPTFEDGDGEKWLNGVFTHLALTNKPRQMRKGAFEAIEARLSDLTEESTFDDLMIALGTFPANAKKAKPPMDEEDDGEDDDETNEVEMDGHGEPDGDENQSGDKEADGDGDETEDGEEDVEEEVEEEAEDDAEEGEDNEKGEARLLSETQVALKKIGIVIPEGTGKDDFIKVLHAATLSHLSTKAGANGEQQETPEDQVPDEDIEEAEDPMSKQMLSDLMEQNTKMTRKDFSGRIGGLLRAGKITKEKHDALLTQVNGWQLSDEGSKGALNAIESTVAIYEELPDGACLPLDQRLKLADAVETEAKLGVAGKKPAHAGSQPLKSGEMDEKEVDELVKSARV
jgi:hypothetical protein